MEAATLTKDELQNNVSANFRHVRKSFGISGREMGEILGIHRSTIDAIENRAVSAPIHVYKLSKLINVSIDTLYTQRLNA